MKVYFISGLAADARVFKHLRLPSGYEAHYLDWISPVKGESLHDYAIRLSTPIQKDEPFVLIGLSLGGMIAAEIAKMLPARQLILISSIPESRQLPPYFRLAASLRLHKIVPISLLKSVSLVKRLFTTETSADKKYLSQAIRESDPKFIRWAVDAIMAWRSKESIDCIHIHGSEDLLLPVRYTRPTHVIKGGGHLMVMNRAKEINTILNEVLGNSGATF